MANQDATKGYGSDQVSFTKYKFAIVSELRRETTIQVTFGSFYDFVTENTVSQVKFYCNFDDFPVSAIHYCQLPFNTIPFLRDFNDS